MKVEMEEVQLELELALEMTNLSNSLKTWQGSSPCCSVFLRHLHWDM